MLKKVRIIFFIVFICQTAMEEVNEAFRTGIKEQGEKITIVIFIDILLSLLKERKI